ncbi:MAG: hypothetical protein JKX84_08320, partial [Flavobacteriales bacterium]|nr:hypothetical protein [Flavobacteriales bacterium]
MAAEVLEAVASEVSVVGVLAEVAQVEAGRQHEYVPLEELTINMRKLLTVILGISFLVGCSNADYKPKYGDFENSWEHDNLFGKVKTLEQLKANISGLRIENSIATFNKEYTELGNISYQEYFDRFGNLQQYVKNDYNEKGWRTKSISENLLTPTKSIETARFNSKGKQISTNVIFNDTMNFTGFFEYNSYGDLIHQMAIQDGDTTSMSFEYKYNEKGKVLWQKQAENGGYEYFNEFKYAQNENLIELLNRSDFFGEMKSVYEYDRKNRIKKIIQYEAGEIEKETSFDERYNQVSVKFYVSGTVNREMKYEY